jgi:CheY-like chemotaxis protein/HPt (histidine-containing phosphotransfer) domain-containing protein/anti-sigma regulatory factor (Ser/Thr protein kinase)
MTHALWNFEIERPARPKPRGPYEPFSPSTPPYAPPASAEAEPPAMAVSPAFLAELSHELRTAAMAVVGYSEMLLDPRRDLDDDRQRLAGIRANGGHLLQLLDSMLDMARFQHGEAGPAIRRCSPRQIVAEIVASFSPQARDKGLELCGVADDDLPETVLTDPVRARRILSNLVGNAIKYSRRGRVEARVSVETRGRHGRQLDPALRLEVRDQGIGMTADEVRQLTRPFYRGRQAREQGIDGSGLGLAITRQLIEQLGGQMAVSSELGGGTVFRVRLPLEADEDAVSIPAREPEAAAEEPVRLTGRVLLIEDNAHHRDIVGNYLRQAGLEVETADGGESALARDPARYDGVVLDGHMPRLSGRATAQALRERGYGGPILLLTADPVLPAPADDDPFTHVLSKTAGRRRITRAIKRLLDSSPSAASVAATPSAPAAADEARLGRLVAQYVNNLRGTVQAMLAAVQSRDHAALRGLAHRMMGSAGLYGFPQLAEAARRLHDAVKAETPRDEHLERCARRIENLVAELARDARPSESPRV